MTLGHILVMIAILLSPFVVMGLLFLLAFLHQEPHDIDHWKRQPP